MQFGLTSDTLDIWGNVTETGKPLPTIDAVTAVLPAFTGEIRQVPPMMSALKKNGVRLYDLARQGIEVERESRPVTVYRLELLADNTAHGEITLRCACSKGTYIRTLCDDIGRALGCGAVMTALRRTKAVGFSTEDCLTPEEARAAAENGTLTDRLLSVDRVLSVYPALTVTDAQARRFSNGGALDLQRLRDAVTGLTRVYHPDGSFIGLGIPENESLAIAKLF